MASKAQIPMAATKTRWNVIANYFGQGWTGLMGFAFVPVYVKYLGVEAYGVVGLFAVLQACLSLLDLGLTPTLTREMARSTADAYTPNGIRDLLRSVEVLCFMLAVVMAIGVFSLSDFLAHDWLKLENLPVEMVSQAITIMGIVAALRFGEGIYRGALYGLQRQVWFNGVNGAMATARYVGAVVIVALVSPTLEAFFIWQAFVSVVSLLVFAHHTHRILPPSSRSGKFSRAALHGKYRFAGVVFANTLLALMLTQMDKIILSRFLSLTEFGYYALAGVIATALYMLVTPLTSALYPRMTELVTRGDHGKLISIYHQGSQLVTVLIVPIAVTIAFFPGGAVFLWTGDAQLAGNVGLILFPLMIGTMLNGLMYMPFYLQYAFGWTELLLGINLAAVCLLFPALFYVVPRYGAVGAAWLWVALNIGYIILGIQLMHRRILPKEKFTWYLDDIWLPAIGVIIVGIIMKIVEPDIDARHEWLIYLSATYGSTVLVAVLLAQRLRPRVMQALKLLRQST